MNRPNAASTWPRISQDERPNPDEGCLVPVVKATYVVHDGRIFMVVAYVVHGLTHQGFLNWMDSFNRVAMNAVLIAWWYCAMTVGGLISTCVAADEELDPT